MQTRTTTSYLAMFGVVSALLILLSLISAIPADAQTWIDKFNSSATTGNYSNDSAFRTGSQSRQFGSGVAPALQGATSGTIGPQGADATYIVGLNTAGTVRVNNLANIEALLNVIANGMEILGIAWGGPTMLLGFMHLSASSFEKWQQTGGQRGMKQVVGGASGVLGGLATPGLISWLVASSRDANLFN